MVSAAIAAYLFAATFLYCTWKRNTFLRVTYGEVLLAPAHWNSLKVRRAKASIAAGLDAFKKRRWEEAEVRIYSGLQADPALLDGRVELAQFYLATGRWPSAAQLLGDGIAKGYPDRGYLAAARQCAQVADDVRQSSQWAQLALARLQSSLSPSDAAWILDWAAQSLAAERRCDDVLDLESRYRGPPDREFRRAEVVALISNGRGLQALEKLADWDRADPRPDVNRNCYRAVALRQAGRLREMESELDAACSLAPENADVYAFAAGQRHAAGRKAAADLTLNLLLAQSGRDQAALERACRIMAEEGYAEGIDRIFAFARKEGLVSKQLLLTEAVGHLSARDPGGARPYFLELNQAWNLKDYRERILQRFYSLIYETVSVPEEQSGDQLLEYCSHEILEWQDFAGAAEALSKAGRQQAALGLVELGMNRFPSSYHLDDLRRKIRSGGAMGATANTG